MKFLILCADGLCPDLAAEYGFPKMPYETELKIPENLYYDGTPASLKIWPTIFSKEKVNLTAADNFIDSTKKRRKGYYIRKGLFWTKYIMKALKINYRNLSEKLFGSYECIWKLAPTNKIDTIFNDFYSITWNVPGICPEFLYQLPFKDGLKYRSREFDLCRLITDGMSTSLFDLGVSYFHTIDYFAHRNMPVKGLYLCVHDHIRKLTNRCDVMLVSDHGCDPATGYHTEKAYLGCTRPIFSKSVSEVGEDIHRIMNDIINLEEKIAIPELFQNRAHLKP